MTARTKAVSRLNASLFGAVREFERFRAAIVREAGISVTDLRALARIGDLNRTGQGSPLTPKQLAAQLELTTGAVTALTDRLIEHGLITREANPGDRRSLLLGLTPAGSELLADVVVQYEKVVDAATRDVDTERLDDLSSLLTQVIAYAKQQDFA
jgi:DNA-binding MarR family transcriptional regulator